MSSPELLLDRHLDSQVQPTNHSSQSIISDQQHPLQRHPSIYFSTHQLPSYPILTTKTNTINTTKKNTNTDKRGADSYPCLEFQHISYRLNFWNTLHSDRTGNEYLFQNYYSESLMGPEILWNSNLLHHHSNRLDLLSNRLDLLQSSSSSASSSSSSSSSSPPHPHPHPTNDDDHHHHMNKKVILDFLGSSSKSIDDCSLASLKEKRKREEGFFDQQAKKSSTHSEYHY